MNLETFKYDNRIVRAFAIATVIWGLVGFSAGLLIACQLFWPDLNLNLQYTTFGRLRPSQVEEPYEWRPFSGADAFPSGHTTMAFALATSLANEIRRPWATVGLMVVAAGTGWSRLNDNKHWVSDVAAGATLGVTSAQLIDGRWTVFHLRPPTVFLTPGRAGLAWRVSARLRGWAPAGMRCSRRGTSTFDPSAPQADCLR